MTTIDLKDNERIDDLERCGYRIIQNKDLFCFGIDAVILSSYAKVFEGDNVVDLCAGNGIIPILLAAKTSLKTVTGLEIVEENVTLAKRSIEMNGISDRVHMVNGDIKNVKEYFEPQSMDVVTCNPPYMIDSHGIKNPSSPKAIARHEIMCDFTDVAKAAKYLLKNSGRLYIVHRPFRLVELFETLTENGLEPKRMKMVHPYVDKEPNMVLIEAVKGGKRRLSVEKPLIVYDKPNEYTKEIYDIYGY